ncbi:hypothetical protein T484DRAFT_1742256 [Baffinella frigidus]|nr:hypothetical protein T484DRAFT_1742256 [Cryptophyta sp. CCMP2293]
MASLQGNFDRARRSCPRSRSQEEPVTFSLSVPCHRSVLRYLNRAEAARSVVDGESRGGRSTHLLSRAQYLRSRALLRNIIVVGEASAPELVKTYLEVNKVTFDVATFDGGHF